MTVEKELTVEPEPEISGTTWLWIALGVLAAAVLGGSLAAVWETESHHVDEVLDRTRLISPHAEVEIRAAALGQDSSLLGAAEQAFAPLLTDPQGLMATYAAVRR